MQVHSNKPQPRDEDVEGLEEGEPNPTLLLGMHTRWKCAFSNVMSRARSTLKKYTEHLKAYKAWLIDQGIAENEFEGVLNEEPTSGWVHEGCHYREIRDFTDEELQSVNRIWEMGGRVTEDRVSTYIALLGEAKPHQLPSIEQKVTALVFWAKIETLMVGGLRVPII